MCCGVLNTHLSIHSKQQKQIIVFWIDNYIIIITINIILYINYRFNVIKKDVKVNVLKVNLHVICMVPGNEQEK